MENQTENVMETGKPSPRVCIIRAWGQGLGGGEQKDPLRYLEVGTMEPACKSMKQASHAP